MLSATAASVEDFSLRFPLHALVWVNDYGKLEREIQTVCVCGGGSVNADVCRLVVVHLVLDCCDISASSGFHDMLDMYLII